MSTMSGATPQRVAVALAVDIDPARHGFDLPAAEAERVIVAAIDRAPGLQVAAAHTTTTSRGESRAQ